MNKPQETLVCVLLGGREAGGHLGIEAEGWNFSR